MNITILGYKGRFGSVLVRLLGNHNLFLVDKENLDELNENIKRSDLVFLAVPPKVAVRTIREHSEKNKFVEISSVKYPFLEFKGRIISIHPLFGPKTFENSDYKNIVFIEDLSYPGSIDKIKQLFPSFKILTMNADAHDYFISKQLVLPYTISLLSYDLIRNERPITRSFSIFRNILDIINTENKEIMLETIRNNPFSKKLLDDLILKLKSLEEDIYDSNN